LISLAICRLCWVPNKCWCLKFRNYWRLLNAILFNWYSVLRIIFGWWLWWLWKGTMKILW
jgi:hypothetical protein